VARNSISQPGLGNHGNLCGSHSYDYRSLLSQELINFFEYCDMMSVISNANACTSHLEGALTDLDCPIASLQFVILTASSASFYDSRAHSKY
jgi:hypothetical protein